MMDLPVSSTRDTGLIFAIQNATCNKNQNVYDGTDDGI